MPDSPASEWSLSLGVCGEEELRSERRGYEQGVNDSDQVMASRSRPSVCLHSHGQKQEGNITDSSSTGLAESTNIDDSAGHMLVFALISYVLNKH